jgi:hypothetical protein
MNKKINIFGTNLNGSKTYLCSTNMSRTCREAVEMFKTLQRKTAADYVKITANFDK